MLGVIRFLRIHEYVDANIRLFSVGFSRLSALPVSSGPIDEGDSRLSLIKVMIRCRNPMTRTPPQNPYIAYLSYRKC